MERPKLTDEQAFQAIHACAMRNLDDFVRESVQQRLKERGEIANKRPDTPEPEPRKLPEKAT
jgi:hypothetical protein